jgi:hypothetical protein
MELDYPKTPAETMKRHPLKEKQQQLDTSLQRTEAELKWIKNMEEAIAHSRSCAMMYVQATALYRIAETVDN